MPLWKTASRSDLRRLEAIGILMKKYPWWISQIFHPTEPCLQSSPQALMRGASSGERILIGLAFDFWSPGLVGIQVADLNCLDDENFQNVLTAIALLRTL